LQLEDTAAKKCVLPPFLRSSNPPTEPSEGWSTFEERRNAMNYESPEVVEIGRANEVILGSKLGWEWDEIEQDFTMDPGSVIDRDE
jgi:hypothetical protein